MSDLVESSPEDDSPNIDRDGHLDGGSLGRVVWITDVGHARSRNEDRLLVREAFGGRFLLLVVADGAGGHNRGDKAATTVVTALAEVFTPDGDPPEGPPARWLNDVILDAHAQVRGLAKGESRPPASTLVGMLIERDTLCGWRFHVGDSRIYGRKGAGDAIPWTRDHNITNGLIDRGLPVTQAMKIAEGGKLTQVMGGGTEPEPEIRGPFQLEARWSFLICSDGVYGYNEDRNVMGPSLDPDVDLADRALTLKEAVLAGDAMDNLTAILWDVPADAKPVRQRLGLVEPFDSSDVGTMLGMSIHPGAGSDALGPTGPPPPSSMPNIRSITDEDVDDARAQFEDEDGASDEDLAAAQQALDDARKGSAGLAFGVLLLITLAILAVVGWLRSGDDDGDGRMTVEEMEQQRAEAQLMHGIRPEATPAPTPTPAPKTGDPVQDGLDRLVAGFDTGWWRGLEEDRRDELLGVLRDLLAPRGAAPMTLAWEAGEPVTRHEARHDDWPAPGGENAELAGLAWSARGRILGLHGDLGMQKGVSEAMREAACDQVALRWPRGNSTDPGDGLELGTWLAACLPAGAEGASVGVRLGGWPDVGWTLDDITEATELVNAPEGGKALLSFDYDRNPRLVELGQLAAALANRALTDVQLELKVVLPAPATEAEANAVADTLAAALRSATHDTTEVSAVGVADEALLDVDVSALLPAQAAKVRDLQRWVEVTLFRASPLELDEDDGEDELPGTPDVSPDPASAPE